MYKLKRVLVWMRRIHHSRGFGVQSPYDYRFVRYVVNEHWPYYAYDELKRRMPSIDKRTRKLCRLYFRIANWRQPQQIVNYQPSTDAYQCYMQEGCRKAKTVDAKEWQSAGDSPVELARMTLTGDYQQFYETVVSHTDNRSLLIVERIKRDKETKAFWKQVEQDERTGVTFDLYYCGIVFFNKQRYKQNYVVNF